MIKQLKPWMLGVCLFSSVSVPVLADTTSSEVATDDQSHLTQHATHAVHREQSVHLLKHHSYKVPAKKHVTTTASDPVPTQSMEAVNITEPASTASTEKLYTNGPQSFPIDIDVPGQSFVSTGPYIGIPLMYSGGNLIINSPNINEDVTLLNMRKVIRERLAALGRPSEEDHAHLLLSGIIEGTAYYTSPGVASATSGIDVSTAELDGYILGPSSWTSGLFAFNYDNNVGTSTGSLSNNSRTLNSRLYASKAFIVIGDFQKSPFYGTIGQMYVPFGTYSSNMISSPLTKILGRTRDRALLVGYQQQGPNAFYASTYVFNGPTHTGNASRINNGGVNLGYRYTLGSRYSGDFGAGVIANLADSIGMQFNGNGQPYFGGFGAPNNYGEERIVHGVSALDFRGLFSIGKKVDLLAEFVTAMSSFSATDLTYNGHGAKPRALNLEASYTFNVFERPSSLAVGYGSSWQGLALGLSLHRYLMTFNTSIWKDTFQSLELRHDSNYATSDTATGNGTAVTQLITGAGKSDNMITAQFDIYF